MTTTTSPAFTPEAAEIVELALTGRKLLPSTEIVANRWGGFDVVNVKLNQLIRVTCEDTTWTLRNMTGTQIERGSQTFTGCFARPAFVAAVVAELL